MRERGGEWLIPDNYKLGGDRFSFGAKGHTAMVGVLPHGNYPDVKRFVVVLDSIALATPEEVAPAIALRQANVAVMDAALERIAQRTAEQYHRA